ncbi:MAG: fibronectin type III domain-containing protein [Thermoplasmata archaeon]|nr:MAG: fibronectin type III domain-containing protein [Thermoplasmata archaeon]
MKQGFIRKIEGILVLVWVLICTAFSGMLIITENAEAPPPPQNLIIGDDTPDEILLIDNTVYHHYGNVYVYNQGEIQVINGGEFRVYGNIWMSNDSKIVVNNSIFGFLSVTKWQFSINLFNVSELQVKDSQIYSNLFPNLINPNDNSKISFNNVTFTDWFSCKMADNSTVDLRDSYGPKNWISEFFFMDYATGNFSNLDGIINVFTVFHDGSIIDYSPLWNEYVFHFEFPADVPFSSGVYYSFVIDDCHIYGNSPLLEKGCDVTVRNCITSVIIRPTNDDSLNISGLVANTYQSDWNAPLSDRQFRAVNSILRNWHLHIFDYSSVNLVNSIFSEILCIYWNCSLYMRNTIYKGDAGPFWVFGESTVYAQECVFFAEDPWGLNPVVYVKDYGTLCLYNCYVYPDFTLEDLATVYLLNSETFREPLLLDASVLWVAKINSPPTGLSNDSVPILGSAYIDGAPYATTSFGSYQFSYAGPPSYDVYTTIGPERTEPVKEGVLEYWNTSMIPPAIYYLRMDMKDSDLTDNVTVYWVINIQRSDVLHYPPSEPQTLAAIESNGKIELNWDPPSDNGNASISNYTIYRGLSMGDLSPIAEIGNLTQFIDENVTPRTTYFYKVSATNKMGEGPLSDLEIISVNPLVDLLLGPADISFSDSTPIEGQRITIYGNIQAQNLAQTEMVWVELVIDGIPVDVKPVTISASTAQIQFNWTAEEGNHDITMNVDIVNTVTESNETNNTASEQITVLPKQLPDLSISEEDMVLSKETLNKSEILSVSATIYALNLTEDVSPIIELLVDGNPVDYISSSLSEGSTYVQFNWTASEGTHDISIEIDSTSSIEESDETNNVASRQVEVLSEPQIDLFISEDDISLSKETLNENDMVTVTATVHALNLTDSQSVIVEFLIDGTTLEYKSVVLNGNSKNLQFNWTTSKGEHDLTIVIYSAEVIVESNETNNIAIKHVNVNQSPILDLKIESSDITFSNETPTEGDVVTIFATISAINLTENVTAIVELIVDDVSKAYSYVLISSETANIQFNWSCEKGDRTIAISVDSIDAFLEQDETNNLASKNIVVAEQSQEPTTTTKEEKQDEFSSFYIILAIAMILIGIIIGLIVGRNISKKKGDDVGEEEDTKGITDQAQSLEEIPEKDFEDDAEKEPEGDVLEGRPLDIKDDDIF